MDTGADCIARDIKAIVETRLAMAEKLGALEQHVGITMQHARTTMTEVADKTTSIVRETIHVAKAAIDPSVHAARHPWVFVGGALVLGYAVGTIYRRGRRISNGGVPYYPPARRVLRSCPRAAPHRPKGGNPGCIPFIPTQRRRMGERDIARPTDSQCGLSWDKPSKTNSVWQGIASSNSDAVSSAEWSDRRFPPSCRWSAATVANGTLAPIPTPRIGKSRTRVNLGWFDLF